MTTELNTMTLDELKTLKAAVITRIGQLDPREAFIAEVDENNALYADDRDNDDYDDDHYLEWLGGEVRLSEEEKFAIEEPEIDSDDDKKIAFLEVIYLKQNVAAL
jgi:hypothetical protein